MPGWAAKEQLQKTVKRIQQDNYDEYMNVSYQTQQQHLSPAQLSSVWSCLCAYRVIVAVLAQITRFDGDMVTRNARGSSG